MDCNTWTVSEFLQRIYIASEKDRGIQNVNYDSHSQTLYFYLLRLRLGRLPGCSRKSRAEYSTPFA